MPAKSLPPSNLELAAAFPQLEVLELIGQGGMGFVFKARQPKIERLVALKTLPQALAADPAFAERFAREGRLLARLNHPNIVTLYDFGQAGGFFYLLMEFVDGVNLRQAMKAGRFTPAQALAVVPKICEALQFAHNEGILHRDIKPENILLDAKGRVKIADFGIAKLVSEPQPVAPLTASGALLGTPHYMAPEQLEHSDTVDQRADIYSLGVVFYEMLTGELPLGRFQPPSHRAPMDARLDEVVLQALEKEPGRRYQKAGEVKTAVETIAATPAPPPAPAGPPPRSPEAAPTRPDRFWRYFAVGVLVLLAIPVGFAVFFPAGRLAINHLTQPREQTLPQQTLAATETNSVPAQAETTPPWAPELAPGEKPDFSKILEDAKQLTVAGHFEEALQRYQWHFQHAQEFGDSFQSVIRLSSLLSDWEDLGRRYPKAKQALVDIRDKDTREIAQGRGYLDLFRDVQAINHTLQDDDATYTLFKTVRATDPKLAERSYFWLQELLVTKGEYQWCLSQIGDPQARFDSIRRSFEMERARDSAGVISPVLPPWAATNVLTAAHPRPLPRATFRPDVAHLIKQSSENRFVGQTCQLLEILCGADHKPEAEQIRTQALALLDDPRLKSALTDAEQRIQQRSLRTSN